MNEFKKYLIEKAHINEKYIPYYLKWVETFINQLAREDKTNFSSEEKNDFLVTLASEYEDWQVKQADHALRLYRHFLSIVADKNCGLKNQDANELKKDTTEDWRFAAEEMRRVMRLRHLSYHTEKTYISWLRNFCAYLNKKAPDNLSVLF